MLSTFHVRLRSNPDIDGTLPFVALVALVINFKKRPGLVKQSVTGYYIWWLRKTEVLKCVYRWYNWWSDTIRASGHFMCEGGATFPRISATQEASNSSLCLAFITQNTLLNIGTTPVKQDIEASPGVRGHCWNGVSIHNFKIRLCQHTHNNRLQRKQMGEKKPRANYKTFTSRRIIFFLQPRAWRNENSVFMYSTANDSFLMMFGCWPATATGTSKSGEKGNKNIAKLNGWKFCEQQKQGLT